MSYAYYIKNWSHNERSKKQSHKSHQPSYRYLVNIISDIFLYIYSDKKTV